MKVVEASFFFLDDVDGEQMLKNIERAGRVCYKSEGRITNGSAVDFVNRIIKNGHESVLEHEKISVCVICDRGISHEIVRHRIASYSQESTRYCNYSSEKFGKEITVVSPAFWKKDCKEYHEWENAMKYSEQAYFSLLKMGASPQEARGVLPNSLKTEIVMTMNLREWRHFFLLRTSKRAHPQMQEIANMMLRSFKERIPIVFDDIEVN